MLPRRCRRGAGVRSRAGGGAGAPLPFPHRRVCEAATQRTVSREFLTPASKSGARPTGGRSCRRPFSPTWRVRSDVRVPWQVGLAEVDRGRSSSAEGGSRAGDSCRRRLNSSKEFGACSRGRKRPFDVAASPRRVRHEVCLRGVCRTWSSRARRRLDRECGLEESAGHRRPRFSMGRRRCERRRRPSRTRQGGWRAGTGSSGMRYSLARPGR